MLRTFTCLALLLCAGAAAAQSSLLVVDPGAEPRTPLRYQYKAGQDELAVMDMSMSGWREVNGVRTPLAGLPTIRQTIRVRITEIFPDGSARIEYQSMTAEADLEQVGSQASREQLSRTLAGASQLSGWVRSDTRGGVIAQEVSLPEGAISGVSAQMLQQMMGDQSSTTQQLPLEPVGVGARWREESAQQFAGMRVQNVREYTLLARSGNRVELGLSMLPPVIEPQAGGAAVTAGAGGARGSMVIDLDRLTPTMTIEAGSEPAAAAAGQGPAVGMAMRISLKPVD